MKFQICTLVDITQTDARKGDDSKLIKQQQNFLTVLQTLSLRSNPIILQKPKCIKESIKNYNFGSKYKNNHNVWVIDVDFELEESHNTEFMQNDFNFIPIITDLDETIKFQDKAFITLNEEWQNICFYTK